MRQITQDAVIAFTNDRPFRRDNTEVRATAGGTQLLLHNNIIAARFVGSGKVMFTLAGWGTPTTRERVNGLLQYLGHKTRVYQHKHEQFVWHEGKEYPIAADDDWYISDSNQLEIL
ncbi:MAG: hypothetical protein JSV86_06225 [Gemmatimonadota bacterium]|nr:MAG: hypothetical protein JSV86_06225 [Gemmatimonadota bacterium]